MSTEHEFKIGDRVRVKRGERHIGVVVDGVATGTVGEVTATGVGTDKDLTCVYLPEIHYEVALETAHLDPEPIEGSKRFAHLTKPGAEQRKSCAEAVTRAEDHMVNNAGFSSHQVKAMAHLFSAMIDSHEANRGTK